MLVTSSNSDVCFPITMQRLWRMMEHFDSLIGNCWSLPQCLEEQNCPSNSKADYPYSIYINIPLNITEDLKKKTYIALWSQLIVLAPKGAASEIGLQFVFGFYHHSLGCFGGDPLSQTQVLWKSNKSSKPELFLQPLFLPTSVTWAKPVTQRKKQLRSDQPGLQKRKGSQLLAT